MVDDEVEICSVIRTGLALYNLQVYTANSTIDAQQILNSVAIDVVLLDWMLPRQSGIQWLAQIRKNKQFAKVLVFLLTAKKLETDHIQALENGADDFITKPFVLKTLAAKIQSAIRRKNEIEKSNQTPSNPKILNAAFYLDSNAKSLYIHQQQIPLSVKLFAAIEVLYTHFDRYIHRDDIFAYIWGRDRLVGSRTIDVYITQLRNILVEHDADVEIRTKSKVGYALKRIQTNHAKS